MVDGDRTYVPLPRPQFDESERIESRLILRKVDIFKSQASRSD